MTDWLSEKCPSCGGYGIKAGDNFLAGYGPDDCEVCDGLGKIWISENDRVALWPGGPFRGSWPGRFGKLKVEVENND